MQSRSHEILFFFHIGFFQHRLQTHKIFLVCVCVRGWGGGQEREKGQQNIMDSDFFFRVTKSLTESKWYACM